MENKEKILITSALPYVNNIPHLGNLIGCVLSADVFARFKRSQGHEVLYICGADEHGTATETKAKEEGVTPKQLCDKYFKIHTDIYKWFNISFDHFGRTSEENHHKITQDIFNKVLENGFVKENTITQPFCEKCNTFLADRFVRGTCPHCKYEDAGGDQCDNCGKLLNPDELINPRCKADGSTPIFKETKHLFLELDKLQPKLEKWVKTQSMEGFWTENTVRTTNAWFKEGLKPRAITRDLRWGIKIPNTAFGGRYADKVFYVWFDAPIGYISITEQLTKNWKDWWKNKEVKLYQFMGKDNIPFHSIIFPATLMAADDGFNLVYHINSTEYLNYEKGQFSKSRGTGVFGDNAKESNIPADVFRYYLLYMRPENSDSEFTWKGLQERLNNELLANFGNFINRTLTFISRFFDGNITGDFEGELSDELKQFLSIYNYEVDVYKKLMTEVKLREGLQQLMKISALGNALFQDSAPWKKRVDDENSCKADLFILVNIVKDLAIMCEPFMPSISKEIFSQLNIESLKLDDVGLLTLQEGKLNEPKVLFKKLEDKEVEELKNKYSGQKKVESKKTTFQDLDLVVGKIVQIHKHPEAEKLYVEKVDLGNEQIQIVSGLVPYYTEEELLNKKIIVVKNLQKAKLRGVESEGMLLAAEQNAESSTAVIGDVEVLSVDETVGTKVILENQTSNPKKEISFKEFLEVEIEVKGGFVFCENKKLIANKTFLETDDVDEGRVH
ncbi:MAG: methionine--tRNA ligase [Candidatus Nanoarchaeia archaeon]|nr:methionine--tRNA ligase [Candidatus Nanoarchaeia archaeon]